MILDTHILLWYFTQDDKLSEETATLIDEKIDEVMISPISAWEISILANKKRVVLKDGETATSLFQAILKKTPVQEAAITTEIALLAEKFEFHHQDPADKFIAATAYAYKVPLMTRDERLLQLGWLQTIKG